MNFPPGARPLLQHCHPSPRGQGKGKFPQGEPAFNQSSVNTGNEENSKACTRRCEHEFGVGCYFIDHQCSMTIAPFTAPLFRHSPVDTWTLISHTNVWRGQRHAALPKAMDLKLALPAGWSSGSPSKWPGPPRGG